MGNPAEVSLQSQINIAQKYFEPQLENLGLGKDQITNQNRDELALSLEQIKKAIQNHQGFGTLKLKLAANMGLVIVQSQSEFHFEIGILPILLERKQLIVKRLKSLEFSIF